MISYGVGNTARALAATRSLERIDVVDVSADVLRMSPLIWPGPGDDPLRDGRVHANIEDGRFFLLTVRRRYDLITGEPPPPKSAGIVNLDSREYFALMRGRRAGGGVATYWVGCVDDLRFRVPICLQVIQFSSHAPALVGVHSS